MTISVRTTATTARPEDSAQVLFDQSPDCIKILDLEGRIVRINPAGLLSLRCDAHDAVGRIWPTFWDGPARASAQAAIAAALRGEPGRMQGRCAAGRWWDVCISPLRSADGSIEGLLAVSRDISGRLTANEALLVSEERFRTLAELAPVGIFQTNGAGHSTFVNRTWSELSGLATEEAEGDGWIRALHPDDRDRVTTKWTAAAAAGLPYENELRFLRPDGRISWLYCTARPIRDAAGDVSGYIGTLTDITPLRRAEEEQRRTVEKFQTLADLAPCGIFQTSIDGACIYVNRRLAEIYGRPPEALLGNGWLDQIHPDDRQHVLDEWAPAARGVEVRCEFRCVTPGGQIRWLDKSARPVRALDGRVESFLGAVVDVTEARESMEALRRSQDQLGLLASAMEDVISLSDVDRRTLYISPSLERLLGYTAAHILSTDYSARVHPDDLLAIESARERNLRGEATRTEYRALHRDGRWVWIEVTATPIPGPDGRTARIACCSRNIGERKRVEAELRQALEEQHRLRDREVSLRRELDHRVRNNLASLQGLLSVYQRSGRAGAHVADALRSMVRAMVDVHDFISRTPGAPVPLAGLIARLAAPYRDRIHADGQPVPLSPAQAGPMAMVLQELLTNSAKHGALSMPDGRVSIRWDIRPGGGSFALSWHEQGGPAVRAPDTPGVGLRLIEGFVRGDLRGDCEFWFNPDGLRCMLRASLETDARSEHGPRTTFQQERDPTDDSASR